MRRAVITVVTVLLTLSMVPIASAQEDESVVLRVGTTQDWSSLNVTAGYLVSEWEVWLNQYRGLTNFDEDYEIVPDLAESWEASDDGLTYTYTLRDGLLWSDGEPLTSDDIVWTIETAVQQNWINHAEGLAGVTAEALDDRTVRITTAEPEATMPSMDTWIVPRHIWEPVATDAEAVTTYDGLDGVGAGPYVLADYVEHQTVTMEANPNWWGWEGREPGVDRIIFRLFSNPDAMVAALQSGEIDIANGLPGAAADLLESDDDIVVVPGYQGSFSEIALNGGAAEGQPHPALLDIDVRHAIAYGIDREQIVEDLYFGYGQVHDTFVAAADEKWNVDIPDENRFSYDPDRANQILDDAGYLDSDGDGIREMPDGTNPIVLRHLVNTNTDFGVPIGELYTGWMSEIGLGVDLLTGDDDQTFESIVNGDYESFWWGWGVYPDPGAMISSFTTDNMGFWNDANWTNPRYDELNDLQRVELDEATRIDMVHEMQQIFNDAAIYVAVIGDIEISAYRAGSFEGWVQQPSDTGPIIFNMTAPSYPNLVAAGEGAVGGGGLNWWIVGGAVVVLAALAALVASRRSKSADDRE